MPKATISLVILSPNEPQVAPIVKKLAPHFDQTVVINTGDSTFTSLLETPKLLMIKHSWVDDFAQMRNIGLDQAACDWVFCLDDDELIDADAVGLLYQAAENFATSGYVITTRNYSSQSNYIGWQPNLSQHPELEQSSGWFPSQKVRLFKRTKKIRFAGVIHEGVSQSIIANGGQIAALDAPVVHHYGYLAAQSPEKTERYLRLGEQKLKAAPDCATGHLEVGLIHLQNGNLPAAQKHLEQAAKLDTKNIEIALNLSSAYMLTKNFEPAATIIEQVLKQEPDHPQALHNLAIIKNSTGDAATAIALLQKLIAQNPDYQQAYKNLASIYLATGAAPKAIATIEQVLKRNPRYHEAQYLAGIIKSTTKGSPAEVMSHLELALQLAPKNTDYQIGAAKYLQNIGQYQPALQLLDKALKITPTLFAAHYHRGLLLGVMGNTLAALAALELCRKQKSDIPELEYNFAMLLLQNGQRASAAAQLEYLHTIAPEHPKVTAAMAAVRRKRIVIVGFFGLSHLGLDRALANTLKLLKAPDNQIVVVCLEEQIISALHPQKQVLRYNTENFMLALQECDFLIVVPDETLRSDFLPTKPGSSNTISVMLSQIQLAQLFRKPIILVGCGFGPFFAPQDEKLATVILQSAARIYPQYAPAAQRIAKIATAEDQLGPNLTTSLLVLPPQLKTVGRKKAVLINIYPCFEIFSQQEKEAEKLYRAIALFADYLAEDGYQVSFLIIQDNLESRAVDFLRDTMEHPSQSTSYQLQDMGSIEHIANKVAQADLVLAMRGDVITLALDAGSLLIPISDLPHVTEILSEYQHQGPHLYPREVTLGGLKVALLALADSTLPPQHQALAAATKDSAADLLQFMEHFDGQGISSPMSNEVTNGTLVMTLNNLGMVLLNRGNLQAAANSFSKALDIDTQFAPASCNLGVVCVQTKQYDKAEELFKLSLQMDPNFQAAKTNLAKLHERIKNEKWQQKKK